jgi:DNA-directed RNA polymerase subunit K/omega
MSDTDDALDPAAEPDAPPVPRPKAPPIESRFLFVDVAAMRAKQLRRGALPRLDDDDAMAEIHRPVPHKAERVAMEEVRRGLVLYDVPRVLKYGETREPSETR